MLPRHNGVHVVLTSAGAWFLLNKGDACVEMTAQEIYGFNVGDFKEIPSGPALY